MWPVDRSRHPAVHSLTSPHDRSTLCARNPIDPAIETASEADIAGYRSPPTITVWRAACGYCGYVLVYRQVHRGDAGNAEGADEDKPNRNCSARHPFDQLRTGLNPSLTVILSEAKNLPIAQGKLCEESPPSGVETLHFIQGDIELECNYSRTEQLHQINFTAPVLKQGIRRRVLGLEEELRFSASSASRR